MRTVDDGGGCSNLVRVNLFLYQMSSLRDRLRRVQTTTTTTSQITPSSSTSRELPHNSCIQFLRDHPITMSFRLDADAVHSAIVHLDKFISDGSHDREVAECKGGITRARSCFECSGYLLVDEHNGFNVCSDCGLVQTRDCINVMPEYNGGVDVNSLPPLQKRARGIHGVSKWMVQSLAQEHETSFLDELNHMNQFTNLALDDILSYNRILGKWSGGHFTSNVRIAACLLRDLLKDRFPDGEDVRRRRNTVTVDEKGQIRHKGMPNIDRVGPVPTFPCPDCGVMTHTRRGATVHCKLGVKRPREFAACRHGDS